MTTEFARTDLRLWLLRKLGLFPGDVAMKAMMYYRFEMGSVIRQHPSLFLPLIKLTNRLRGWNWPSYITPETELVLEGYFRTGNTFAVRAFDISQPRPVRMAHHTHAIATLLVAARRNLPTLVLLRKPADTVMSAVQKIPGTTLTQHLKWYIRYYETVDRVRGHFHITLFDELTADFGQVIQKANRRFATDFAPFEHTEENVREVFDWIETMDRRVHSGNITQYSIPLQEKRDAKRATIKELEEEYKDLLDKANHLYDSICARRLESVP